MPSSGDNQDSNYLQILISSAHSTFDTVPHPSEWTWSLVIAPKAHLRAFGDGVRQYLLQNGTIDEVQPGEADNTTLTRVLVAEIKDEEALVSAIKQAPASSFASDPLAVDASAQISNGHPDLSSDDVPVVVFTNPSFMFVQSVYNSITEDDKIINLPKPPSFEQAAHTIAKFLISTYGQGKQENDQHDVPLFDLAKGEKVASG